MLFVTVATVLTTCVPPLKEKTSLIIFFAAVVFSSFVGGLGPSLLAVGLSAFAWATFVVPPNYSYLLESPSDVLRLALFVLVAVITSSMYEQTARARRDLRKHQNRLRLALEAGQMGVWDYDLLKNEFWTSPELREIFAVEESEFAPTFGAFLAFVDPADRTSVVHAMTHSRESRLDFQLEHRIIRRDGSVRWIATRGRTFVDSIGRAERMIGLVVDVTDRHTGDASGVAAAEVAIHSLPPGPTSQQTKTPA